MSDDTRRILELVADGKITVDEAQQLLHALDSSNGGASAGTPAEEGKPSKLRWVLINVHKTAREGKQDKDVNIRVPIAVIKRMGT